MMQTTDSTTTTTTSMTSIADDNQGSPDPVGNDASKRMASYWLIVCAVALLIGTNFIIDLVSILCGSLSFVVIFVILSCINK